MPSAPAAANTIDCPVWRWHDRYSAVLAQTTTGNEVQVTDTINAYLCVRLDKGGQTQMVDMDRRCFGERGNERGNRKRKYLTSSVRLVAVC
jgi:hypothetical protein